VKKIYLLIVIVLLFGAASIIFLKKPATTTRKIGQTNLQPATTQIPEKSVNYREESINFRAGFAIFTNGLNRSFTASMYHNLSDNAYITSDNPNIVLVKKPGITWGEFFDTLPFNLSKDCLTTGTGQTFCTGEGGTLKFYLNGRLTKDLLSRQINDGDRALITYGNENENQAQIQLQQVPNPSTE